MKELKKILHIDSKWEVNYNILVRERTFMKSFVPLDQAINMLKKTEFDLIISEPHNQAILATPDPYTSWHPFEECQRDGVEHRSLRQG